MSEFRVQVYGQETFSPREWLRRDVLWASLVTPYKAQFATWLNGTAAQQHNGNVSRQALLNKYDDPEFLSASFFNQGKNIAGMVSSATLFKACLSRTPKIDQLTPPIRLQAAVVDATLSGGRPAVTVSDIKAYGDCERLIRDAHGAEPGQFGVANRFLQASRIMTALAAQESADWVAASVQNQDGSLPSLTIEDGGHPRSGSPRVAMLQPIFHQIITSSAYQELAA